MSHDVCENYNLSQTVKKTAKSSKKQSVYEDKRDTNRKVACTLYETLCSEPYMKQITVYVTLL